MRRCAPWVLLLGIALTPAISVAAEEKTGAGKEASGEAESGSMKVWEWANFLVLAGGLGYLIGKNAGPAFAARSKKITADIVESEQISKDAEARAADVDRRLANLETEIAALKVEAQKESEAETARHGRQVTAEIDKVRVHSEQEIASAAKAARMELKQYAAELAVELAAQKIRARMNPETQDALVRGFVRNLGSSPHTT